MKWEGEGRVNGKEEVKQEMDRGKMVNIETVVASHGWCRSQLALAL